MTAATVAHVYMHLPPVEVHSYDLSTKSVGLWQMTHLPSSRCACTMPDTRLFFSNNAQCLQVAINYASKIYLGLPSSFVITKFMPESIVVYPPPQVTLCVYIPPMTYSQPASLLIPSARMRSDRCLSSRAIYMRDHKARL